MIIVKKDDLRGGWRLIKVFKVLWKNQYQPLRNWYETYNEACVAANILNGGDDADV